MFGYPMQAVGKRIQPQRFRSNITHDQMLLVRTSIAQVIYGSNSGFKIRARCAGMMRHAAVTLVTKRAPDCRFQSFHQEKAPDVHRKARDNPIVPSRLPLVNQTPFHPFNRMRKRFLEIIEARVVIPGAIATTPQAVGRKPTCNEVAQEHFDVSNILQISLGKPFIPHIKRNRIRSARVALHTSS